MESQQKHYTSEIIAYSIGNADGVDAIRLKDGTQFESLRLNINDESNFTTNASINSDTIAKGHKVTYIKTKHITKDPKKQYKILKIETKKGKILDE